LFFPDKERTDKPVDGTGDQPHPKLSRAGPSFSAFRKELKSQKHCRAGKESQNNIEQHSIPC
jgi:hypothetical protein